MFHWFCLPTLLPPLPVLSIQSVQMVQSSCWVSLLTACRIAAFPLFTPLMHQPVVFVLQSGRVTPPSLFDKGDSAKRNMQNQNKTWPGSMPGTIPIKQSTSLSWQIGHKGLMKMSFHASRTKNFKIWKCHALCVIAKSQLSHRVGFPHLFFRGGS